MLGWASGAESVSKGGGRKTGSNPGSNPFFSLFRGLFARADGAERLTAAERRLYKKAGPIKHWENTFGLGGRDQCVLREKPFLEDFSRSAHNRSPFAPFMT